MPHGERSAPARAALFRADTEFLVPGGAAFPISIHSLVAGAWRIKIVMRRACGFYPRARSCDEARRILDDARLLDFKAMVELFPDGTIERERFAGFTKSLIAIH
jgi:hypothetical protein